MCFQIKSNQKHFIAIRLYTYRNFKFKFKTKFSRNFNYLANPITIFDIQAKVVYKGETYGTKSLYNS